MTNAVIVLDSDVNYASRLLDSLQRAGQEACITSSIAKALEIVRQSPNAVLLADVATEEQIPLLRQIRESRVAVQHISTIFTSTEVDLAHAISAIKAGACDYIVKPRDPSELAMKAIPHVRKLNTGSQIISVSENSLNTFKLATRVARTDVSVFIHGESGTGKEIVAGFIHASSRRCDGPFIALNCAAIPEQMLEAMLFGHEKGAFTGAHQRRPGKFELAHGGTILLDEVSELPLSLQAKLLRVLQEREIEPVGGKFPKPVDVRVIATTNRNLQECVRDGSFREDLFYRLNVFPLNTAPLRHRREDILPLAYHFLHKHGELSGQADIRLSSEAQSALVGYDWPGNVRELENIIQRALVMTEGEDLATHHLDLPGFQAQIEGLTTSLDSENGMTRQLDGRLRDQEFQIVSLALKENTGNRKATALALGVSERTLRHKIQKWREQGKDLSRIR